MRALIDGDILKYRIGFALVKETNPDYFYEYNCQKVIGEILTNTETGDLKIFISGGRNFRLDVASEWPFINYKGNRKDAAKPPCFNEIHDYLVKCYETEVTDGIEADDALGIAQCQSDPNSTIICSDDKDMLMIPGHHYNIRTRKISYVTEEEAWRTFYQQVLTGDWQTDNIPGLKGVGIKTAQKLLKDCKGTIEMHERVLDTYISRLEYRNFSPQMGIALNSGFHIMGDFGLYSLVHTLMQLIWIKRGNIYEDTNFFSEKDYQDFEDKEYEKIGT